MIPRWLELDIVFIKNNYREYYFDLINYSLYYIIKKNKILSLS